MSYQVNPPDEVIEAAWPTTEYIHLVDQLDVSYEHLVAALGEPFRPDPNEGDGKIDAEWVLLFDDGTLVTIYNYKDGPSYLGPRGTPVEQIRDWHVGGVDRRAAILARAALR